MVDGLAMTVERVAEPEGFDGYRDVVARVAHGRRPIVLRSNGNDVAAVVPMALLEPLLAAQARMDVEARAKGIDWTHIDSNPKNFAAWLEGEEEKPF